MKWLWMIIPVYITYYTVCYAIKVWKKEKNLLAVVLIVILALSVTVAPLFVKKFWK